MPGPHHGHGQHSHNQEDLPFHLKQLSRKPPRNRIRCDERENGFETAIFFIDECLFFGSLSSNSKPIFFEKEDLKHKSKEIECRKSSDLLGEKWLNQSRKRRFMTKWKPHWAEETSFILFYFFRFWSLKWNRFRNPRWNPTMSLSWDLKRWKEDEGRTFVGMFFFFFFFFSVRDWLTRGEERVPAKSNRKWWVFIFNNTWKVARSQNVDSTRHGNGIEPTTAGRKTSVCAGLRRIW